MVDTGEVDVLGLAGVELLELPFNRPVAVELTLPTAPEAVVLIVPTTPAAVVLTDPTTPAAVVLTVPAAPLATVDAVLATVETVPATVETAPARVLAVVVTTAGAEGNAVVGDAPVLELEPL